MANERLIPVMKVWTDKDKNFGEKDYLFNPEALIEGMESCRMKNQRGVEIECTKIFYPLKFIIIKGSMDELLDKCRDINLAICLVKDIYKEGMTVKQFLNQIEGLNVQT